MTSVRPAVLTLAAVAALTVWLAGPPARAQEEACARPTGPSPSPPIHAEGRWRIAAGFPGAAGRTRRVYVILPDGYEREPARRYPALYVHDGEAMHRDYLGIERNLDPLVASGEVEPFIVVGIGMADGRDDELKPPLLEEYTRLFVEVIKPWVDATFRTRCGRASTATLGYSLGGLAAFYAAYWYPQIFGRVGCMSASFWVGGERPRRDLRNTRSALPLRLWIDVGTREPGVGRARAMRATAIARGMRLGRDLGYFEDRGARHGFEAGGRRLARALRFLLSSRL